MLNQRLVISKRRWGGRGLAVTSLAVVRCSDTQVVDRLDQLALNTGLLSVKMRVIPYLKGRVLCLALAGSCLDLAS